MPRWTILLPALTLAAAAACNDAAPDPKNPLTQFTAAAQQMQKAAEDFANRKPVPPVAFRELIELLPTRIRGLERKEPEGETTTVGSWQYSQAEVDFVSRDGSKRVEVGIFDYAHIPFLYLPFNAIIGMNVAKESRRLPAEHEDRGLSRVRGVESHRQQRGRRAPGRPVHREGAGTGPGRGRGAEGARGHGPRCAGEEGLLSAPPLRPLSACP